MVLSSMYDVNYQYEKSKQFQLQLIKWCSYELPTMYKFIVTEEETQENRLYKNIFLNLYENIRKLEKIITVVNNYRIGEYLIFEVRINVYIFYFIMVLSINNIGTEEKKHLLNWNIKELRKSTKKINSYYNKYVIKPHLKKKRKSQYVTLNSNNIYSGIVENIYKNKVYDPNIIEETVRPEEIITEIKEEIRKCI